MGKAKLFIENMLIYGLGGIISKLVPILMLPIVTRLMPGTIYFGLSDMSNTILSFGSAVAVIGMYDAMYRMFFEKDDLKFKKEICSTALTFTLTMSLIVCALMVAGRNLIAKCFFKDTKYSYLVYITAVTILVSATNTIVAAPTRMQNKRKVFLITNTISPILSYSISIPLILMGHYVIALPLAALIAGISMELIFYILNRSWFDIKLFKKEHLKPLLALAIPLFPNFLIYWIFNSSDKIMITNILDVGQAGIYSVGSKLGHTSQLIYTAFAGGWQYFAFYTMKDNHQVETNSKIYEYLGLISFAATSIICVLSQPMFKLLFPEQYYDGYIAAPYLFMAPLLQMLYQIGQNQFLIIKRTWPGMFILSAGAITNVVFNYLLIPVFGIEGAAIATLFGYVITCVVDIVVLIKCGLMKTSKRFLFAVIGIVLYFLAWRVFFNANWIIGTFACIAICGFYCFLYRKDISRFASIIKNRKEAS